jgi:hypothetical protein
MTSFPPALLCAVLLCGPLLAQQPDSEVAATPAPVKTVEQAPPDNRILGVLPNYRTADGTKDFEPLTAGAKFKIAGKDSFDWPGFVLAGAFAGFRQLSDDTPSFGQGVKGYSKRYAAAVGDQVMGNMMTEAILPSLLHEDPRYFRKVNGSVLGRTGYALTRILVTRTDADKWRFNTSEVLGNGITASIGNAYYRDNRGFGDTMARFGGQIATDALSNVLKEFWPDIKRRWFHHD